MLKETANEGLRLVIIIALSITIYPIMPLLIAHLANEDRVYVAKKAFIKGLFVAQQNFLHQ